MPYIRGLDCIRNYFEGKVPIDEWAELKKRLDSVKKPDPKGHNKQGVVDIDDCVGMVLEQY